jgi:hypothetical protein|tara:strand:+ start:2358 stop:2780 length:423 start_codon:yes stop_codon:yes gene_type:complete
LATNYFDYRAGLGNVGSYQSSAKPFLSASIEIPSNNSIIKIEFPNVTRFVTIKNTGPDGSNEVDVRIGFSENGVNDSGNNNWLILNNQESYSADWRVQAVYMRIDPTGGALNATASVIAGLTTIDQVELHHNWTGSQGVG